MWSTFCTNRFEFSFLFSLLNVRLKGGIYFISHLNAHFIVNRQLEPRFGFWNVISLIFLVLFLQFIYKFKSAKYYWNFCIDARGFAKRIRLLGILVFIVGNGVKLLSEQRHWKSDAWANHRCGTGTFHSTLWKEGIYNTCFGIIICEQQVVLLPIENQNILFLRHESTICLCIILQI